MPTPSLFRVAAVATAAGAIAVVGAAGPVSAVDDTQPTPCSGLAFKDPASDQANTAVPEAERTGSTELVNGFLKHDPAKAAEATTYNLTVAELSTTVPTGWTTQSWNAYYQTPDDAEGNFHFVRSILDFTGTITYEHGRFVANPTGAVLTGASVYDGKTNGKFFEGKLGVIQLVVPADLSKAGTAFQGLYASSGQGRTAPSSSPGYSRGLTQVMDFAPDGAPESGTGKYTVAPCPPAATPGGGGTGGGGTGGGGTGGGGTGGGGTGGGGTGSGGTGGGGTSGGGAGGGGAPTTTTQPLPVTLASKSMKAPKKKVLVVKLRSRETVTNLGARLRKGRKAFGTGKLAKLNRSGKLKIKLKKKLKKGSYLIDLAGNDAKGQRRVTTLSLKIR